MSGRPLIAWTIETALDSGEFSEVIVSTDDPEIAEIAKSEGASVPFTRPSHLANDTATTGEVMAHAVDFMMNNGFAGTDVCCLYPSAIFVTIQDLARSRELLLGDHLYVMSVIEYSHPVQRALFFGSDDVLTPVYPEFAFTRTQDLEPRFHDAGQFYWGRTVAWSQTLPAFGNARAYKLSGGFVVDIDTEEDWNFAERLHAVSKDLSTN